MPVHVVGPPQQFLKIVKAHGAGKGEADGRPEGEPSSHPIPEDEHIVRMDTEGGHRLRVGGNGHEMTGDVRRTLTLHKARATTGMSRQLLEQSAVPIEQEIAAQLGRSIAYLVDTFVLTGSGDRPRRTRRRTGCGRGP